MRTFLLALAAVLSLATCQSSPSASKTTMPADVPAEENAAPKADTVKAQ